jgi:hemoglobin
LMMNTQLGMHSWHGPHRATSRWLRGMSVSAAFWALPPGRPAIKTAPIYRFKWGSSVHTRRFAECLTTTILILMLGTIAGASNASLYDSLGGETVLRAAVSRFADLVVADDRINFTFAEADMSKFKKLLFEQLCNLSGGPCQYTGRDMRTAHSKLNINSAQFNALAEDLYIALGKEGVPYRLQNKLMALLAPMQRQIVNPPHAARAP